MIGVLKLGSAKWVLAGTNTYTGTTTVDNGILAMTATASQTLGVLMFGSAVNSANSSTSWTSLCDCHLLVVLCWTNTTTPRATR